MDNLKHMSEPLLSDDTAHNYAISDLWKLSLKCVPVPVETTTVPAANTRKKSAGQQNRSLPFHTRRK